MIELVLGFGNPNLPCSSQCRLALHFSALGSKIPKVQRPYPLEVLSWDHFSGIFLGKEDRVVYAEKDVVALQTPIFKDTSVANVIVHLG